MMTCRKMLYIFQEVQILPLAVMIIFWCIVKIQTGGIIIQPLKHFITRCIYTLITHITTLPQIILPQINPKEFHHTIIQEQPIKR